jgi:hypothetical protein
MHEVMAKPRSDDSSPKGLLAAAPGDRRIQAAAAIMLGLMSAVWARKATR